MNSAIINLSFDEEYATTVKVDYSRRHNLSEEERAQIYRLEDEMLRHAFADSEEAEARHARFQMQYAYLREEIARAVEGIMKEPKPYWG